jgi:tetratricopeptide (TPR) repeat protein
VLTITSRLIFAVALTGVLAVGPVRVLAQEAAAQAGQPNWKDRGEFDLFDSIQKDTNAQTRLDKLNQWKDKYPQTDFTAQRGQLFLATYAALNQPAKALEAAKEILATTPSDFTGLYYTMLLTPQIPTPSADQIDAASKAATSLLNGGLDTQFAPPKKPAAVTDAQWTQARTGVEEEVHKSLAWVDIQQKQNDQADAEYEKALTVNPGDMSLAYTIMVKRLLTEKKYTSALFYCARAASYDGPGALDAGARQSQILPYCKKLYGQFHGGPDGFDDLLAKAKTTGVMPGDLKIVSAADLATESAAKAAELAKSNPGLAIWLNVKPSLTAADGATYFSANMKDTLIQGLSGKVVSMDPAVRPKTVVLSVEDGTTPDATLQFDAPLAGKVEPGTVLTFDGTPVSFTASPYMITFKVEKTSLKGWTGTGGAAPPARRPAHK